MRRYKTRAFDWPSVRYVYLSPHLDDVVLSCGGTLFQQARQGETIAVVTVFAGSPTPGRLSSFAEELHQRWQAAAPDISLTDPPSVRRQEDIRALRSLNSAILTVHLPLTDCIYRTNAYGDALYCSREEIFGEVNGIDLALRALAAIGPPPPGTTAYAPLGVGHHVDHQLVHNWVRGWALPPTRVHYYEDYPYAGDEGAVRTVMEERPGWERIVESLNQQALQAKIEAVESYKTQIGTFWTSVEAMRAALAEQAERSGGECFWRANR